MSDPQYLHCRGLNKLHMLSSPVSHHLALDCTLNHVKSRTFTLKLLRLFQRTCRARLDHSWTINNYRVYCATLSTYLSKTIETTNPN